MYQQSITHLNRSAVIIAIDCSVSMQSWTYLRHTRMRKMEAAALITNYTIDEIVVRATRGNEIRNYYDIAVVGYSGDGVEVIIGDHSDNLVDIKSLFEVMPQPSCYQITQQNSKGEAITTPLTLHEWVKPKACGTTPLYEALILIKSMLSDWCNNPHNRHSFPPLVINISDGCCSDGDYNEVVEIAKDIQVLRTTDGTTTFVNILLTTDREIREEPLMFPSLDEFTPSTDEEQLLHEMSSILPSELDDALCKLTGYKSNKTRKCFARNASICEILAMADIGTEGCQGIKYR